VVSHLLSVPILLGFTLYRWRFRILDLHPMRRTPGAIGRAEPLRHDAFAAEFAGVLENDVAVAVAVVVVIEHDTRARGANKPR
jgi:hypothetical protein